MVRIRITVDSNSINGKGEDEAVNTLERWEREGKVELVATDRLLEEVGGYEGSVRKAEAMDQAGEVFTLGFATLGDGQLVEEWRDLPDVVELGRAIFGRQKLTRNHENDLVALVAHVNATSDYFMTTDGDFQRLTPRQVERFGLKIRTPRQIVEELLRSPGWDPSTSTYD